VTGDAVIALGHKIVQARAVVNESTVILGPKVFATRQAAAELSRLQRQARALFR
jgi:hypothetical protein